jgi:uncharacterized protein (DUF302 family)
MPLRKYLSMLMLLSFTLLYASPTSHDLANIYRINDNNESRYHQFIEKELQTIGFSLTDPHKRVNDQYKQKWGSTTLDFLSFMPVVHSETILPLLNIDPRIAGFAPFNMLIYKELHSKESYIGHLKPKVMLDILGIDNPEVRKAFTNAIAPIDALITKQLHATKVPLSYTTLPKTKMIEFEYNFEAPEELDEFIEEFQNSFELAFIDKGYLIAGYHNFMESTDDAEEILSKYDAFWTYSLCHLEFSYQMFDNQGARPEAGLFAPCTMYVYIEKDTNRAVIGMFRLENWAKTLNITEPKRLALIERLDREIPQILNAYGMKSLSQTASKTPSATPPTKTTKATKEVVAPKESTPPKQEQNQTQKLSASSVTITLPKVPTPPTPPKAIEVEGSINTSRAIQFSKRTPPNYTPHRFDHMKKGKDTTNIRIGEVNKGRISAYLRGDFMEVEEAKKRLEKGGFRILSSSAINKKKDLISLVFTNETLIDMASKQNRGFIASLRLLVDTKEKKIHITNPLYMAKGFLQEDFDEKQAKGLLQKLIEVFPKLTNSKDALKFQLLAKYQFMNGMPFYQDMIEVASGEDLLEYLPNNKKVLFQQKLTNGATLIGVKLGKRTSKFPKRIGRNNAGMLPYPILIEEGKAKILNPKFYLSYMYPLLKMSEFMTIATIPDAIVKDCKRIFRKKR